MCSKTKCIIISFCLITINSRSQNTFIPDDNFEQALIDFGLDTPPLDDNVLTLNIIGITDLDIANRNITDLTGIEDFISLTNLDCSNNQLTVLNITQNTNLIELYCSENQLTNIDITSLSNLVRLWCFSNQLSSLNTIQNPGLISLRCEDNRLTNLDTSNNSNLNVLICEQNQITMLDVSNSVGLRRFQCGNNQLANLDVSANTNLSILFCEQNQITNLDLKNNNALTILSCFNNQISELDLSKNPDLTDLNCSHNQLCLLNLNNGNNNIITTVNFDSNPDLNCVVVNNANGDYSSWVPASFLNYVESQNECSNFIPIDTLENVFGTSYTLPVLNNGNYFTESNGMGLSLNSGDIITSSQTIYIFNKTTCNSNESSFVIVINNEDFFIPKFFTPNNDGTNDVWQVYDKLNLINNISIYNRNGKLLKFLSNSATSWDGTYNGELLSSDSYWYEIVLNTRDILRGYFALKR
ncbi:MAG: T9SS type B sorting domain-containing protein [Algibacter sp.]|uniref:T9SS type B sorting domain-containing protein n=1 Tax=Algibacter sp. TaxID=1872428 RepID=UPI00262754C6|nr:T9SS type B sorting domain-containing protein [Algibacter sp.]MDG1730232.1 T9SS type B sorting domain-containing protein [Algibacter sp.]MDG2179111.1 T9SS type B sorting domain-containing protein [Algibacter sp.]